MFRDMATEDQTSSPMGEQSSAPTPGGSNVANPTASAASIVVP